MATKKELNVAQDDRLEDLTDRELRELANKALRLIHGGIFGKKHPDPNSFDQAWLERGRKVEEEHTVDHDWQTKIALDHFAEHGDIYYPVLLVGEDFMKWYNNQPKAQGDAAFQSLKDFVKKLTSVETDVAEKMMPDPPVHLDEPTPEWGLAKPGTVHKWADGQTYVKQADSKWQHKGTGDVSHPHHQNIERHCFLEHEMRRLGGWRMHQGKVMSYAREMVEHEKKWGTPQKGLDVEDVVRGIDVLLGRG